MYDPKQIIDDFDELVRKEIKNNNFPEFDQSLIDQIEYYKYLRIENHEKYSISHDIKITYEDLFYVIGILFVLRPFANDPNKEIVEESGFRIQTYFQNGYDSLYMMYISIGFEKLYNVWDRIGDKIAFHFKSYFPNERQIMFANVIDTLELHGVTHESFNWLLKFRENVFPEFNEKRRIIVHYSHYDSSFKNSFYGQSGDLDEIDKLRKQKFGTPVFFKTQLRLAKEGICHSYKLIESLG